MEGRGGGDQVKEEEVRKARKMFPLVLRHENVKCNVVVPPAGGAHLHYVDDAQVRLLR